MPELPDEVRAQLSDIADQALTPLLLPVVAAIVGWFLLLWLTLARTRPPALGGAPPSQDLGGDETPAIVSMFANRWLVTVDAVESTLLDLAARGHLELRQLGDDPRQTTIHVVGSHRAGKGPDTLAEYERKVLDRVRSLAKGGVVPISALTFRDRDEAKTWNDAFNQSVRKAARAQGLSRSRLSPGVKRLLGLAAFGPAGAAALYAAPFDEKDPAGAAITAGFVVLLALTAIIAKFPGERDTAAGREAARRWAGLRRRLADDAAFGDLPPAAVAVWDRYLPYGTALGVNHVCSAVLDLGMGDRDLVWSSYGDSWHRVRVRYPRFWGRYGRTALGLGFWAAVTAVAGFMLLRNAPGIARSWSELLRSADPTTTGDGDYRVARNVLLAVGAYLLVRGLYRVVRTAVDVAAPRNLTGEVLWCEVWRTKKGKGSDAPPIPWLYYVAIDDGGGERTTAWGLPAALTGRAVTGSTVQYTVRPWSRRVLTLTAVGDTVADPIAASSTSP